MLIDFVLAAVIAVFLCTSCATGADTFEICTNKTDDKRSCSHQIGLENENDCTAVRKDNNNINTVECNINEAVPKNLKPATPQHKYAPRLYAVYSQINGASIVNITFPATEWRNVTINENANKNIYCWNFQIPETTKVNEQALFYFDCYRHDNTGPLSPIALKVIEWNIGVRGDYHYHIPNMSSDKSLSSKELFIYFDTTQSTSHYYLGFQTLPEIYGVQTYVVQFYSDGSVFRRQTVDVTVPSKDYFCRNITGIPMLCYIEFSAPKGSLNATVHIVHSPECPITLLQDKRCTSKSITIYISAPDHLPYVIAIATLLCITGAIVLFLFMLFRRVKSVGLVDVLLVYKASHKDHIEAVHNFAAHLSKNCSVQPHILQSDIQHTIHRDPYKWYSNIFRSGSTVKVVLVVASPRLPVVDEYCNQHNIALQFIQHAISRPNCPRIATVVLPYCTSLDLPKEVVCMSQWSVPRQFPKLLCWIHQIPYLPFLKLHGANYTSYEEGETLEMCWQHLRCIEFLNGEQHSWDDPESPLPVTSTPSAVDAEEINLCLEEAKPCFQETLVEEGDSDFPCREDLDLMGNGDVSMLPVSTGRPEPNESKYSRQYLRL